MTRQEYADELGVCIATVDNYIRAVRAQRKRITIATLRAHQRTLAPGRAPDLERAADIKRMRHRDKLTWAQIGDAYGISGTRACKIYQEYVAR